MGLEHAGDGGADGDAAFGGLGRRGVVGEAREVVGGVEPGESVGGPVVVAGLDVGGAVECAGGDFELFRDGGIEKHERGAAGGAEGAFARGEADGAHGAVEAYGADGEKGPGDDGCAGGFAAVLAVAEAGAERFGGDGVADGAAEAGSGHGSEHAANSRSSKRAVQTLSSQRSANGWPVQGQVCS